MFRNFPVKILCFTHLFFNTFFSFCRTSELTLAPYFIEDIPCKRSYFEDFSCPLLLQPDPIASHYFYYLNKIPLLPTNCNSTKNAINDINFHRGNMTKTTIFVMCNLPFVDEHYKEDEVVLPPSNIRIMEHFFFQGFIQFRQGQLLEWKRLLQYGCLVSLTESEQLLVCNNVTRQPYWMIIQYNFPA